MSDLIILLSIYVYQVFDLANMKALMQTAEIKFITVHDLFNYTPIESQFPFPAVQLLVNKLNFEISYCLYLSGCLSSTCYPI